MPWYSLTTLGIDGKAVRREVLYRDSISKVHELWGGRCVQKRIDPEWFGYWITEASDDDEWDYDYDEPRERRTKPYEMPLIFGEELKPE